MEVKIVSSARPLQIQRSFEGASPLTNTAPVATTPSPATPNPPASVNNPISITNTPVVAKNTPIIINTRSAGTNPPVVINTRSASDNPPSSIAITNQPIVINTRTPATNNPSSHAAPSNHPPSTAPAIRKQEFYEEETHSRTNVKIEHALTPADLLKKADFHRVIIFSLLVIAVTLFSILTEDDISLAYILPLVSVASLAFFHFLKL
jgi:hypothetical protein